MDGGDTESSREPFVPPMNYWFPLWWRLSSSIFILDIPSSMLFIMLAPRGGDLFPVGPWAKFCPVWLNPPWPGVWNCYCVALI